MCQFKVQIKPSCSCGIHYAYVPCGQCVDCRKKHAQAWQFRINSEFMHLRKLGWCIAFCTLTYRPENLPHIPYECFVNSDEFQDIPCFDKAKVRKWIDDVRQYCKYHFGFTHEKRMRYFIASELGTLRRRPHYHALLAWPNDCSYEEMHRIVSENWHEGFLFPRSYYGDKDMLPFEVVGDASSCFSYVSKYVCKDLEQLKLQEGLAFYNVKPDDEMSDEYHLYRKWKNTQSFHIQSQSMGFEAIRLLSDEEKMQVFRNGLSFVGDGEIYQVPMYIKNKLLYDPYYVYDENGNRLVQRKASAFFLAHGREIFDGKAEFYQKLCLGSLGKQYYIDRGIVDSEWLDDVVGSLNRAYELTCQMVSDFPEKVGQYYVAWHRVRSKWVYDIPLYNQYMLRYFPDSRLFSSEENYTLRRRHFWCERFFDIVDELNALLGDSMKHERIEKEERIARCLDYFNNVLKGVG